MAASSEDRKRTKGNADSAMSVLQWLKRKFAALRAFVHRPKERPTKPTGPTVGVEYLEDRVPPG